MHSMHYARNAIVNVTRVAPQADISVMINRDICFLSGVVGLRLCVIVW